MYFDLLITYGLIRSPNTGLAVLSVLSALSPYYASLVQMIEFLREKVIRRNMKESNWLLLMFSWMTILPVFFLFLLMMDLVFVINGAIMEPLVFMLEYTYYYCYGKKAVNKVGGERE